MGLGEGSTSVLAGDNAALPGGHALATGPIASAVDLTSAASAVSGSFLSLDGTLHSEASEPDPSVADMKQILLDVGIHSPSRFYSSHGVKMAYLQYMSSIKPKSLDLVLAMTIDTNTAAGVVAPAPDDGPSVGGLAALGMLARPLATAVLAAANALVVLPASTSQEVIGRLLIAASPMLPETIAPCTVDYSLGSGVGGKDDLRRERSRRMAVTVAARDASLASMVAVARRSSTRLAEVSKTQLAPHGIPFLI